jgi:hypothetical protein
MKQNYEFPRITTRGYYNQNTAEETDSRRENRYNTYPKAKVAKIFKGKEVVIFVHGMRNSRWGAIHGARLLRNRLRKVGYKYPVVAFTYDAEIRGAHIANNEPETIRKAEHIAKRNGIWHLSQVIGDIHQNNPHIKIRLVGHSLGCDVINNVFVPVESIHLLGSPVTEKEVLELPSKKIVNFYNPRDEVIREGVENHTIFNPSCLTRVKGKYVISKNCFANDHRAKSYFNKMRSFP